MGRSTNNSSGQIQESGRVIPEKQKVTLNKATRELLKKYNVRPEDAVHNDLQNIFTNEIPMIKMCIESIQLYGDPNIYKVLPPELAIRVYECGQFLKDYLAQKKEVDTAEYVVVMPQDYIQCSYCGRAYPKQEYPVSVSRPNGKNNHICRKCLEQMFNEYVKKYSDIREQLILIQQKADLVVLKQTLEFAVDRYSQIEGKDDILNNMFVSWYIRSLFVDCKLMNIPIEQTYFSNTQFGGIPFKMETNKVGTVNVYNDNIIASGPNQDDEDEVNLTDQKMKQLKRKWGKSFQARDLEWLENQYSEWEDGYDISGKNRELIVEQICLEELTIYNNRSIGADCQKQLRNIQDLLKTGELTPKDTKQSENEEYHSIGELIKQVEQHKPIIHKDKQFEDVDGITKFWQNVVGALSRTAGIDNGYKEIFEENMKDSTVDFVKEGAVIEDGQS